MGHNHKCRTQIPLPVIEEMWDALDVSDLDTGTAELADSEETLMAVGTFISITGVKRKTMRLCGQIGNIQVLILV